MTCRALQDIFRTLVFTLSEMGNHWRIVKSHVVRNTFIFWGVLGLSCAARASVVECSL